MFAVLRKTAMSPIIYEVLDFGAGITDSIGNLLSSGAGIPGFIGAIDKAVKRLIELVPSADVMAGDIFVTNDPYAGGVTHLNDVVLLMPVFASGDLIAWVGNMAHWNDVGGAVPGSMPVYARDIHAEGLRLPLIKDWRAVGEPAVRNEIDLDFGDRRRSVEIDAARAQFAGPNSGCLRGLMADSLRKLN
jgi:N-methylhydantoinase B